MTASPHVIFDRVSFSYGDRSVIPELILALSERRVGLIGSNGSGKSSLLRLIHGLAQPTGGTVTTVGLNTKTDRKKIPSRVGFLFQDPDRQIIFPTVGEEIAFGFEEQGMTRQEARREALAWLSRYGKSHWLERGVQELSEGQKQLVCLISVIALQPGLILLDEPFASLDLRTRLAFARQLEALPQPLIMASHDLDFLARFDRILWLENGRIHADGPPEEVLAAYDAAARAQPEIIP
ncbi:energy-coupling factor ABC transporter ATP-binding protein [Microvirga pakistanensis]|uniref:energy-coupling factor ABC transporter ATP-binding protein n=1 Tax=Microvirga pakistanensis TaxID=1682650 RepID=UPI0019596EB3|nr:ABC transporter ATP-binding protein [Microvirga pakistanensis]